MEKKVPAKCHLGASQFAAALGLNKFLSVAELKSRLKNGYTMSPSPSIDFGHKKEKFGKYFYQKITKNKIKGAPFVKDPNCPQLVGICDGLVGDTGGVEIKCHFNKEEPLKVIPIYYLVQIAGYLHLYDREWWDFVSCCFDDEGACKCNIIRVHRSEIEDAWEKEWYPKLIEFVQDCFCPV